MRINLNITFILLSFIFLVGALSSTCSHAMGKKRFDAIVASHKNHVKGLGGNTKKYTYFQIDKLDRKVKCDKKSFLVVSGKVLVDSDYGTSDAADKIITFIKNHPEATVIADFQRSDNSISNFTSACIPKMITSLVLSNIKGDITEFCVPLIEKKQAITTLRFINFSSLKKLWILGSSTIDQQNAKIDPQNAKLKSLDLSSLTKLEIIFIDLILKNFPNLEVLNIKNVGKYSWFFSSKINDSSKLKTILFNDKTSPKLIEELSNFLLGSKNSALEKLGRQLKNDYSRIVPKDIEAILAKLNLDKIKLMTPKSLKDIKTMKDGDVPTGFEAIYNEVKSMIADPTLHTYFDNYFLPILNYYFGVDVSSLPFWEIPEENVDEFKIAIKHLLKAFNDLIHNKKEDVVASYMSVLLEGYAECETRQVGELNQILAALGVRERQLNGLEGDIWNWVNDFKMESYYAYQKDHPSSSKQSSHDYSEQWSVINTAIKLPSAIRNYSNEFFKLTENQKKDLKYDFLRNYFRSTGISDKIYKKLTGIKSAYTAMDVRTLIANMEGTTTMAKFAKHKKGYDAYFKPLVGKAAPKNFAWETSPITKGEVNRLLVLLRVFNK